MLQGHATLIGSRETPQDVIKEMVATGRLLCDLGWRGRSGLAPGADQAWYRGALQSARYPEIGFENYLPNDWMMGTPDPDRRIYNARTLPDYERATEHALFARGSFNGLKKGGIELHVRNVYQVLGVDLQTPSKFLICYAIPIGCKSLVRGGTNTAVQLAHYFKIPVINMATDVGRDRVQAFLQKHQQDV